MFDALAKKQKTLPKDDTILIVPLPSVWNGRNRREPDFVITYRGRACVIEVDVQLIMGATPPTRVAIRFSRNAE